MKTIDQMRRLPANDNGKVVKAPLSDIFPDLVHRSALDQVPRADILRQMELQMGLAG